MNHCVTQETVQTVPTDSTVSSVQNAATEVVEAAVGYCRENIYLWLGLFIGILIGVVATAIIVAIRNDDMRYK